MKQKKLLINSVLIVPFILGTLLFNSCSKDELKNDLNKPEEIVDLKSESDIEFTKRIERFRGNIVKPNNLKSTEVMNFGEAVYLMEATFNYFHGFSSETFINCMNDSIIIPVNEENEDNIQMNDLQELFININNEIYESFQQNDLPDKHIKFVNIEVKPGELLVLPYIGQVSTQKSTNNSNETNEYDFTWLNQTPYNNQQADTWSLANSWGSSEVDEALETDIELPVVPLPTDTYAYWTDVWSTGYKEKCTGWDPIFSTVQSFNYYEMFVAYPPIPLADLDNDILHPDDEHSFWPYYYGYKNPGSNNWITIEGLGTYANYMQMNKYYNSVYTFIQFYTDYRVSEIAPANFHREPISFDLKINNIIEDDPITLIQYLTITGEINITYAVRRVIKKWDPAIIASDPIKL